MGQFLYRLQSAAVSGLVCRWFRLDGTNSAIASVVLRQGHGSWNVGLYFFIACKYFIAESTLPEPLYAIANCP